MSSIDSVVTTTATGVDGNSYTSAISNDQLTSEDFLTLMLEEMKMQDPTDPMDSSALMDSQLKMSQIESNYEMAAAMQSLQASYAVSALSTAANLIGTNVEDGSTNDSGETSQYKVYTVENIDGELYVNTHEITGMIDGLKDSESEEYVSYNVDTGVIFEEDGETDTGYRLVLDSDGRFTYNEDGTLQIVDTDNNAVTDEAVLSKYVLGGSAYTYAEDVTQIPLASIVKVS
jgi:flagellar basal-body rod modification protein FlgD